MKKLLFLILLIPQFSIAQKKIFQFNFDKGDESLSFLKEDSVLNYGFWAENIMTNDKITEAQYVSEVTARENKRVWGNGDKWAAQWYSYKKDVYYPAFTTGLLNELNKKKTKLKMANVSGKFSTGKYYMVVVIVNIWSTWETAIGQSNPMIDFQVQWKELASNKTVAYCSFRTMNWDLNGPYEYGMCNRCYTECYRIAGEKIGNYIAKKLK